MMYLSLLFALVLAAFRVEFVFANQDEVPPFIDESTYAFLVHFRGDRRYPTSFFSHSAVLFGRTKSGLDKYDAFESIARSVITSSHQGFDAVGQRYTANTGYVSWRNIRDTELISMLTQCISTFKDKMLM